MKILGNGKIFRGKGKVKNDGLTGRVVSGNCQWLIGDC